MAENLINAGNPVSHSEDSLLNIASHRQALPEEVWEAIFNSIPDLVAVIDKNCKIQRVNKAMAHRLGKEESMLVGTHCHESIHGLMTPHEGCPHMAMMSDGKGHTVEIDEPLLGGVFLVSTTPLFGRDGSIIGSVHIARDITSRKKAEEKLQEYNKELEELNASKDKFFSVIAHDLKSPFQGLLGFTDLLTDDFEALSRKEIKHYIFNIRNASYNTYYLLENLLEWSRIQSGRIQVNPVSLNLSDEINNTIEVLNSNAIRKGISIVNRVESKLVVFADQNMIKSVIQNLISNAVKFSHSRSQVIISSEIKPLTYLHKSHECSCERQCVSISIQDFGVGIPQEALQQLFSLTHHHTTSGTDNEPGTGLGLILCKEMIERHGGELTVESKPGKGSIFTFTLPLP